MINQTSEYALRAMAWIATHGEGRSVRAQDLSAEIDVPAHYLAKILRRLVVAELLVSHKGPGGGFGLARAPVSVRFLDILRAVDGLPAEDKCAFGWGACDSEHPCPLHPAWSELSSCFLGWAERQTLAEIPFVGEQTAKLRRESSEED